jgi:hypothetical protein
MHPMGDNRHGLIAVSPDGQRLVSIVADRADPFHSAQLMVYDLMSGQRLLALPERGGVVRDLVFSPDGSRIILGCSDGTVRIREASPRLRSSGHPTRRQASWRSRPSFLNLAWSGGVPRPAGAPAQVPPGLRTAHARDSARRALVFAEPRPSGSGG